MKTKKITQALEITINYVKIDKKFSAFQVIAEANGIEIEDLSYSGIGLTSEVKKFNGLDNIEYNEKQEAYLNGKPFTTELFFVPKVYKKQALKELEDGSYQNLNPAHEIKDAYEYILENGTKEVVLLLVDEYNEIVKDAKGNFVRKLLIYSAFSGASEKDFNLVTLLEQLKNNKNVVSLTGDPLEITNVPIYLFGDYGREEIVFGLLPSQELMNEFIFEINEYNSKKEILRRTLKMK